MKTRSDPRSALQRRTCVVRYSGSSPQPGGDQITLDKPRFSLCREIARRSLRACFRECPNGWPQDVSRAAGIVLPGFAVFELESLPSGVSAIVDIEHRCIGVNQSHSENRKRFAIAHEIGHVALDHPSFVFGAECRQDSILESEANLFAAEFLVPSSALKREFSTCKDMVKLAEAFRVGRDVMYSRFEDVGLLKLVS